MRIFSMKPVIIALVLLGILLLLAGTLMSQVEEPHYKVIDSSDNIEVREYDPIVIAEVEVSGNRKEAVNEGFKILADYIFGNNLPSSKIEMTAPVTLKKSEKLSMTAPVMQQSSGDNWQVRFVMPAGYTLDTLPKPNTSRIKLISIPSQRFAVIRFSGFAKDKAIEQQTKELQDYISVHNLKTDEVPILAFYNPPWTLPFLRRNEIMFKIKESP